MSKHSTFKLGFAGIALIVVAILFATMYSIERIDSGQTGIIVNLAGSDRGVDDAKVETGWVVYNRFVKQLFEYPAFAQIVDYEPFDIQDKKVLSLRQTPRLNITSNGRMPKSCSCVIGRLRKNWNSRLF